MDGEKPNLRKRIGGYLSRRAMISQTSHIRRGVVNEMYSEATENFRPRPVSRQDILGGLNGRYEDGGVQKFKESVAAAGLKPSDLESIYIQRRNQAWMMWGSSLVSLFAGVIMPFIWPLTWVSAGSGVAMVLFSFIFLVVGLVHDFSAWQIAQQRFGGVLEYLRSRQNKPATKVASGKKPHRKD